MKSYMIRRFILSIFESYVDNWGRKNSAFKDNEGAYFVVKIDAENYGYEKDGNTYHKNWAKRKIEYLHIIILAQRTVFTCRSTSDNLPMCGQWKNTSNHNSCFREGIDEITKIGFELWDYVFEKTPEEHRPATRDGGVDFSLGGLFSAPFKCVQVNHVADDPKDSYFRKLTSIEIIKKTIEV